MNIKYEKEYVDFTFGFPVVLRNVRMIKLKGTWIPGVNYVKLARDVLWTIYEKKMFTGGEIRFIRGYFQMSAEEFAKVLQTTSHEVVAWESHKEMWIQIDRQTEEAIRKFLYWKLGGPGKGSIAKGEKIAA